jgi:deoxyribodipyrimidine photolyase
MVLNGDPIEVIPRLVERIGADRVHANSDVTPFGVERDRLVSGKVDLQLWDGNYVHPPGSILTADGDAYRVFTPFYRSWQERHIGVIDSVTDASVTDETGDGLELTDIGDAGESAATRRLEGFLQHVDRYAE